MAGEKWTKSVYNPLTSKLVSLPDPKDILKTREDNFSTFIFALDFFHFLNAILKTSN